MPRHRMRAVFCVIGAALPGGACSQAPKAPPTPAARLRGEPAPVFRAGDVLPREVLRGANYEIEDRVEIKDYGFVFRIRTRYGVIPALGREMLELRLREMGAIERAARLRGSAGGAAVVTAHFEKAGAGWKSW